MDVCVRHDRLLQEQTLGVGGLAIDLAARRLGVSAETVREWQMYQ